MDHGSNGAREPEYLRTAEVARMLHVSPKTISRWANEEKLPFVRTLGGHRRFPARQIQELAERLVTDAQGTSLGGR